LNHGNASIRRIQKEVGAVKTDRTHPPAGLFRFLKSASAAPYKAAFETDGQETETAASTKHKFIAN
jgi:hypothetical protein